jgi:hypothetical protein
MKTLRYLMSAAMLVGANALLAQAPAGTQNPANAVVNGGNGAGKNQSSGGEVSIAKQTPQCQHIITECKKLGFIVGQYKEDNGLWKDCFNPVVRGGSATRDGKPISVPVNPADVQGCKAALPPPKNG